MDNVKNDHYYIQKIVKDLKFIMEQMKGIDQNDLNDNEVLLDSMLFRMIQISENSKKLTEDYKMIHPSVPWSALYGLRNRIVHDYGNVVLDIIYQTLKNDIPEMLKLMKDETDIEE